MKKYIILLSLTFCCFTLFAQEDSLQQKVDTTKNEKKKKGLPLEPGRTINIDTDEGSWMSLDVSPDGKTIAFDLLGDIYMMPITGGKAERFTFGMAFDSHPKFSPVTSILADL